MKKSAKRSARSDARSPSEKLNKEVLRVATGSLKLPEGIDGGGPDGKDAISRVVAVIVGIALLFIVAIAWLIHQSAG